MTRRGIAALLITALALALARSGVGVAADAIEELARATSAPHPDQRPTEASDSFCLTCHGDPSLTTSAASGRIVSMYVDPRVLRDSAHARFNCVTCHTGLERHPDEPARTDALDRAATAVLLCVGCHVAATAGYDESVHGAPVLAGTGSGATCIDCHASDAAGHATTRLDSTVVDGLAKSIAENCGRCHGDALDTYRMTAHSRLVRLSKSDRAATCSSCHEAHATVAVGIGELTPEHLAPMCHQCHDGADAEFVRNWRGHETSASPAGLADGFHKGVVGLMALCLGFGLAHTTIDFIRRPRRPFGGSR